MSKRISQEKQNYTDTIVAFVHQNYTSLLTRDETRDTWRRHRAYDPVIEQELIAQSLLFVSLLDNDLNKTFRQKMLNFIARYLCVYTARSKEMNNDENRAYAKLNSYFSKWLDNKETIRIAKKIERKNKKFGQQSRQKSSEPVIRERISLGPNGKIIKQIIIDGRTCHAECIGTKEIKKR